MNIDLELFSPYAPPERESSSYAFISKHTLEIVFAAQSSWAGEWEQETQGEIITI